jgi:hypothetical protein
MPSKLSFLNALSGAGPKPPAVAPVRPPLPARQAPDPQLEDAIKAYAALDQLSAEVSEYEKRNPQASLERVKEFVTDLLGLKKRLEQSKAINRDGHPSLARIKFKELSEAVSKKNSEWVSFKTRQAGLDQAAVEKTIKNLEVDRRNLLLYFKRYSSPAKFAKKVATAEKLVDKLVLKLRSKGVSEVSAGEKTGAYVVELTAYMRTAYKDMEQKLNDKALVEDAVRLTAKPEKPPRRVGVRSPLVVFEHPDVLRALPESSKRLAKSMGLEAAPFGLTIADPKILSQLPDDYERHLAPALMAAANFSTVLMEFDLALNAAAVRKGVTPKDFQQACAKALEACREGAMKRVNVELKRYAGVAATRSAYTKSMAMKVGSGVAGAGLGLGAMAAGGFSGGAGLVLGIISVAKSFLAIVDAVGTLIMSAETVARDLKRGIDTLNQQYQSRVAVVLKEAGVQTLMGLAGLPQGLVGKGSAVFATVKVLKDMAATLDGKVAGIEVKCREAASQALNAFEKSRVLVRELGTWCKANLANLNDRQKREMAAKLKKVMDLQTITGGMMDEAAELGRRATTTGQEADGLKIRLDELGTMSGVASSKMAAALLTGLGNLALSAGGGSTTNWQVSDLTDAASQATRAAEQLCASAGMMNDTFFSVKDMKEAVVG